MKKGKRKQLILNITVILLALILLGTGSYAWLSRAGVEGEGYTKDVIGFSYKSDYVLLKELANVETVYIDQDGNPVTIGTALTIPDAGSEVYDEETVKLLFGNRSEFETTITNITGNTLRCTVYLADTLVASEIMNYITVGTYSPYVKIYDIDDFEPDNVQTPTEYTKSLLDLTDTFTLAPYQKITVKWYVSLSNNYQYSSYLALCNPDSAKTLVTETIDGVEYNYCVVEYDGFNDTVFHAYRVNTSGEFVDSSGQVTYNESDYVEYTGSYTGLTYKYIPSYTAGYAVKLRGLYIAIGKEN